MTEAFITVHIPERMAQLGYQKYYVRLRDLVIEASSNKEIVDFNALWLIVDYPQKVKVESDYGLYDTINYDTEENAHVHRGQILITNGDNEKKRIIFYQVIIIN